MYCDALTFEPDKDKAEARKALNESPRLTVYRTLVEALEKDKSEVKSITVTGHSLGGALASLCGFDLSLALSEAAAGGDGSKDVYAAKGALSTGLNVRGSGCRRGTGPSAGRHKNWGIAVWNRRGSPPQLHASARTCIRAQVRAPARRHPCTLHVLTQGDPNDDMYVRTALMREKFIKLVKGRPPSDPLAVGVVTFAAPRVGNYLYAEAFRVCKAHAGAALQAWCRAVRGVAGV